MVFSLQSLTKLLTKQKHPMLMMFYAPCKYQFSRWFWRCKWINWKGKFSFCCFTHTVLSLIYKKHYPWEMSPSFMHLFWKCHINTNFQNCRICTWINIWNFVWFAGCGYCKRLKPDYAQAATELKGEAVGFNYILHYITKLSYETWMDDQIRSNVNWLPYQKCKSI